MSSQRRIDSSRANGALSRGPVTPEGKQRSSRNATRHGLLAGSSVLQGESQDAFAELLDQYVQSFNPEIPVQMDQIEEMTSAYWRMRRLWAIETKMMDDQINLQTSDDPMARITDSFSILCDNNKINVLNRYESRLHRIYQRCLRNLLILQNKVKLPNEPTL
jgi:hypothetical protein